MRHALRMLAFFGLALLAFTTRQAEAASISCSTAGTLGNSLPLWDNVTPNLGPDGCELGSGIGGKSTELSVNTTDSMFGLSDWDLLRDISLGAGSFITGSIDWSDLVIPSGTNSLMLVLGDGANFATRYPQNGATVGPVYVGYLLALGTTGVNATTPFARIDATFPNGAAITTSNYQIYASPTAVPEPATLLLFGTGLAVAGVRRYRQRQK